ncbi:MAG: hypothetical protein JJE03_04425 [Peptostreptococcaceae bacterium]|nr:hypothetical protein [Peptostreptococcaceae bacterium]
MGSEKSFSTVFFKIYDKYISHGDVSFGELKIPKIEFTNICMNADYVFDDDIIIRVCDKLALEGSELEEMMSFVKGD